MNLADTRNMQQSSILKPQDVALLVKLLAKREYDWRQVDVAQEMGLSQGEVAKSLQRLVKSGLVHGKRPNRIASLELLIHAIKYVFPVQLGPLAVGVPTGVSSPAHEKMVVQGDEDVFVWPSSLGKRRGQVIRPLYPKLAEAVLKDKEFYDLMAAVEILRVGRARERKLAEQFLEKRIMSS
jgi:DNA-binding Lrp family transcriptional regulator